VQGFSIYRDRFRSHANRNEFSALFPINGGGPSLLSEKTAGMSADDLPNIITNGKDHMPKYAGKLTSEEIGTLVQQIKVLNKK
jgi:hypothetical protein